MGPLSNANRLYFKDDVAFWNEIMRHGSYDEFWQARDIRRHLKGIKPAVMTVGGWYDAENLFGALETYKKVEASSPGATNVLVMGPWRHGGWSRGDGASLGPVPFHSKTGEFFRERIEFPFFQYHLKGKGTPGFPEAWVFETGTNQWRTFDAWPPRKARPRSVFLRAGGTLGFDHPPPASESAPQLSTNTSAIPAHPVEYTEQIEDGMVGDYMIQDQRVASRRPDVLVYTSDELKEDMTIVGPIGARLFVSTSGTDSDWIVKLIDVYPDDYPGGGSDSPVKFGGYQQLVRGDVMRGKFRNSLSKPEPFVPNAAHARELRAPGRLAHVPGPPQDHGPDPEQLVPAGQPQPADVCGYLSGPGVRLPAGDPARVPRSRDAFPTGTARAPAGDRPKSSGSPSRIRRNRGPRS